MVQHGLPAVHRDTKGAAGHTVGGLGPVWCTTDQQYPTTGTSTSQSMVHLRATTVVHVGATLFSNFLAVLLSNHVLASFVICATF